MAGFRAYDSASRLLLAVDKLCIENADETGMMTKPYLRLVQFAYPYLSKVFAEQTQVGPMRTNVRHLRELLGSPLARFIRQCLCYFLKYKADFDQMIPDQAEESKRASSAADVDMKDDDHETDFSFLAE